MPVFGPISTWKAKVLPPRMTVVQDPVATGPYRPLISVVFPAENDFVKVAKATS